AADKLQARPEVQKAYRRMRLAFPARAFGGHEILGRDINAELIAEGVDVGAVDESVSPEAFADDPGTQKMCASNADCVLPETCYTDTLKCEKPIPAVISPFLVEM